MKINTIVSEKNLYKAMRDVGYHPDKEQRSGFLSFSRTITSGRYPRFHIYYKKGATTLDIHLDQKPNRYQGARDHGAEYDGLLVEKEAARIKNILS